MIRVFHTSVAPHVQQAALAFHEAGLLDRLVTSVVHQPQSPHQRGLTALARLAGFDAAREFRRRTVTSIPPEKIESRPWGELLRVAVSRLDRGQVLSDLVWEQTERAFDLGVAKHLSPSLRAVYGFEYCSRHTFTRARALGIPIAYEIPAPEPLFVHQLLQEEYARFPELETAYTRHVARREAMWIARRKTEWNLADVVIAASRFTRDSYQRAGWDASKVRILPLGAPEPAPEAGSGGGTPDKPLRLIWAGTFGIRKGAHYVLEAWRSAALHHTARLDVYGTLTLPEQLLSPPPPGIHFHGPVPRDVLWNHFLHGDALLFPTLCDGFGMVVTEAWSRGLPVLATPRAGAAEHLADFSNGRLFPPADANAIADIVHWCAAHRRELRAMRPAALETAARWQWSDYRRALREAVLPLIAPL